MIKLLEPLSIGIINDFRDFEFRTYQIVCFSHLCKGRTVLFSKSGRPMTLGRAVEVDRFKTHLEKEGVPDDDIDRVIDALITGNNENVWLDDSWFATKHAAWVTWNDTSSQDFPFEFVTSPYPIKKLCANMGLLHTQSRLNHYTMTYDFTHQIELKKPTVTDAALHDYFVVSDDPDDNYGYTRPWHDDEVSHFVSEVRARPEAVHLKVSLTQQKLRLKLHIANNEELYENI